jgi:L-asparagine oxygenase
LGFAIGPVGFWAGGVRVRAPSIVELSAVDQEVLTEASLAVGRYDVAAETEEFVLEAQIQAARLSEQLRRALFIFRRFGDASGGLLLRGLPLGTVPPTPVRPGALGTTGTRGAAAMSVLLACLGDQYGFRPELGGRIVQDILPVRGFETQQISLGSTVDLECHVETAFSIFRSDYVALLCLREDRERQAGTTLSSIDAMLPLLDAATVDVLREPRFRTKIDVSFRIGDGLADASWVDPISVLSGPSARPHLRVDFAETEGKDATAQEALEALQEVAAHTQIVVRLETGDLLVVDNNRALHGRTPFVPRYDGTDRWLLRSFVTKDLQRSEGVRSGDTRIVELDYTAMTAATSQPGQGSTTAI